MHPNRRHFIAAGAAALAAGGFAAAYLATTPSEVDPAARRRSLRFDPAIPARVGYRPRIIEPGQFLRDAAPFDTSYIPPTLRRPNRDGSCVHLTTRNLFIAHGLYAEAEQWSRAYHGGEYSSRHSSRLAAMGIRFAVETGGDARFLDWACGNLGEAHRGAGITLLGAHMLNLLDIDPADAADPQAKWLNNWISNYTDAEATIWPRARLLDDWRRRGGWAFTIISTSDGRGSPPPPTPWVDPNSPYLETETL